MALALISSQLTGKLIQQATNAAVQIGQAIASETNEPLGQTVANELKDISTAYARSFTETVAAATNGLFTANALATTLGWSRNKAFAEADGHERVASNRGQHVGRTTLNESRDQAWARALGTRSELFSVNEMQKFIQNSKMTNANGDELSLLEASHALVRFVDIKAWGLTDRARPERRGHSIALTKDQVVEIVTMAYANRNVKSKLPLNEDETLKAIRARPDLFEAYKYLRDRPCAHLMYKFALPVGPPTLHHAAYIGQGSMIEVMNINVGQRPASIVQAVVAPSTLINFIERTYKNMPQNGDATFGAVHAVDYTGSYPGQVIQDRAIWAIGKCPYNVLFTNCENFVTWVFSNLNSNETCIRLNERLGIPNARTPGQSVQNSLQFKQPSKSVSRSRALNSQASELRRESAQSAERSLGRTGPGRTRASPGRASLRSVRSKARSNLLRSRFVSA